MEAPTLSYKLDNILRELQAIKENTTREPEVFKCEIHGYALPVMRIDKEDGTRTFYCAACVRSAP